MVSTFCREVTARQVEEFLQVHAPTVGIAAEVVICIVCFLPYSEKLNIYANNQFPIQKKEKKQNRKMTI